MKPRLLPVRRGLREFLPTNPLRDWVTGKAPLCDLFHLTSADVDLTTMRLRIEIVYRLEVAHTIPHRSLEDGLKRSREYVNRCLRVLGEQPNQLPQPIQLTPDQVAALKKNKLHKHVPSPCYPIYFMGVVNRMRRPGVLPNEVVPPAEAEPVARAAYIEKASSKTHRFAIGHLAISKLHGPQFSGCSKNLYVARPLFRTQQGELEVPVEWIPDVAQELVLQIEHQLIFELQPELNTDHKDANIAQPRSMQVINLVPGYRELLNGWLSMH